MRRRMRRRGPRLAAEVSPRRVATIAGVLLGALLLAAAGLVVGSPVPLGRHPHPVKLVLPRAAPLSAVAQLGARLFHDPSLSASGRLSCASCHDPAAAYGPRSS